jgi:hypothetical protein
MSHCRCRGLLLHLAKHDETHSPGLPWTSDRPVAQALNKHKRHTFMLSAGFDPVILSMRVAADIRIRLYGSAAVFVLRTNSKKYIQWNL